MWLFFGGVLDPAAVMVSLPTHEDVATPLCCG